MNVDSFFPPTPDVQHLPTLFRRIQQGEIRVPAFQRGFVWKEAQVIELLESVFRGYPIGSLLFWSAKEPVLRVEKSATFPFPDVPEKYPLKFLLDGLQRLTTLYGVFHWPDKSRPGPYNIIFDLVEDEFRHFEIGVQEARTIHLSSLFSPRDFLLAQKELSIQPDSESLMEKAIRLHAVFQEYMIPTVTIEDRSIADVVSMFERVNSTGTKLNAVDFMRAVTWSRDFDLNVELNQLSGELRAKNFFIEDETLVKALAVVTDRDPTPGAMLDLRNVPPKSLQAALRQLGSLLERARVFLLEHLGMETSEYLPYEGQLLVLTRFLQLDGAKDSAKTAVIERWLWATSLNEELRGKPDHYVVRMLSRLADLIAGDFQAFSSRLSITPDDLLERRFIRGKALSSAFACMFARNQARSFVTGERIPSSLYMGEFSAKNFDGLLSIDALNAALGRTLTSNKVFANTFLFSEDDLLASQGQTPLQLIDGCIARHGSKATEIFGSQFMSPEGVKCLRAGDLEGFLFSRAASLVHKALEITT